MHLTDSAKSRIIIAITHRKTINMVFNLIICIRYSLLLTREARPLACQIQQFLCNLKQVSVFRSNQNQMMICEKQKHLELKSLEIWLSEKLKRKCLLKTLKTFVKLVKKYLFHLVEQYISSLEAKIKLFNTSTSLTAEDQKPTLGKFPHNLRV